MKDNGKPVVVIVDDEEMILTTLKSFFMLETDYSVATFSKPREAVSFIEDNDVNLVISDFLMPEMDGIDFLLQVKERRPTTTRILLTGFADKENAIKAINKVGIFQYIEKPWDNTQLKLIVENGIERNTLLRRMQEMAEVRNDLIKALI